ncbi:hypothetical protein [Sneathiella sp.]|uniref:hypothetical protein n=1 Tax=Sneathiella sp. TaxID=1964365 RepID=UPI00262389D0|nr:hypothetical protein [Sneathiella sp.]MDF2368931.1 hypothetical protein [Sneathiella sp.]
MIFKYLNIKPGVLALGLVAVIAGFTVLSLNEPVSAATASADCGTVASGQDQACEKGTVNIKKAKSDATDLALLTPATGKAEPAKVTSNDAAPKQTLTGRNQLGETLALFAIALAGIVFLGRRRKRLARKN